MEKILKLWEEELPAFFDRRTAIETSHGILGKSTLAMLEYDKVGPPTHKMGRKIVYMRDEFMQWARDYYGGQQNEFEALVQRLQAGKRAKAAAREEGRGDPQGD